MSSLPTNILILNGSIGGEGGNTDAVLQYLITHLAAQCAIEIVHLATDLRTATERETLIAQADGFVFATGTYWDSWGSPMQRFLEDSTHLESSTIWLGKPAVVVVTMHSVGGKGIVSRLQGVLSTMGLAIPPMTGFAYSLACHLAMSGNAADPELADFWQFDDFKVIAHNLIEAATGGRKWKTWIVDKRAPSRRWMPAI